MLYVKTGIKYVYVISIVTNNNGCQNEARQVLTLSQTTNFRLPQTERVCRQQF